MRKIIAAAVCAGFAALGASAHAGQFSQPYGMDRNSSSSNAPDVPHCDHPIGVAAIKEPEPATGGRRLASPIRRR